MTYAINAAASTASEGPVLEAAAAAPAEARTRLPACCAHLTVLPLTAFRERYRALGYTIGREHCRSTARVLGGPFAGATYQCRSLTVHESDTGRSAYHVDARRDQRFWSMMDLRGTTCSLIGSEVVYV